MHLLITHKADIKIKLQFLKKIKASEFQRVLLHHKLLRYNKIFCQSFDLLLNINILFHSLLLII